MRISDWSSDVCSSDLLACRLGDASARVFVGKGEQVQGRQLERDGDARDGVDGDPDEAVFDVRQVSLGDEADFGEIAERSEERRVGKECGSTGRSGWSP